MLSCIQFCSFSMQHVIKQYSRFASNVNKQDAKQDWLLLLTQQDNSLFCKTSLLHSHCLAFSSALSPTAGQTGSWEKTGAKSQTKCRTLHRAASIITK